MVGQLCWSCIRASGNSRASERYCTQEVMCIIRSSFVNRPFRPETHSVLLAQRRVRTARLRRAFHTCPGHRSQPTAGDLASFIIT